MVRFGICTPVKDAVAVKSAGWDFVEENVQNLFQGTLPEDQWKREVEIVSSPLPVSAANCLVPGNLKITGEEASLDKLSEYMQRVLARAGQTGVKLLVFGSGGARQVPAGFDPRQAERQIVEFAKMSAQTARRHGVTLVMEPLHKAECNVINTVAEAMAIVRAVAEPNFRCLVDSYHFWIDDNDLDALREAMPSIAHVHVADKSGRTPPGESGSSDYLPFFAVLKAGGYDGMISVEAPGFSDFVTVAPRSLKYLNEQWQQAN